MVRDESELDSLKREVEYLQHGGVHVLRWAAVCCDVSRGVLRCVAVCCDVSRCVAMYTAFITVLSFSFDIYFS